MESTFVLLAGDARQRALLHLLLDRGKSAAHLSACRSVDVLQSQIADAKAVILPVPASRDGVHLFSSGEECLLLDDVFGALQKGQHVFGGALSSQQLAQIEKRGAIAVDLLKDEAFVLKNAAFTAQGALRLLLEHLSVSLNDLPVLITGFGRVAKATAALLKNVGCRVTVGARSEVQRTEARLTGMNAVALSALPQALKETAAVVNTVPAPLFDATTLQRCKKDTLYLELASAPFGANESDVRDVGLHYVFGGALPGRFCADSCAEAMLDAVKEVIF